MGNSEEKVKSLIDVDMRLLGFIENEHERSEIFSSADVLVHPSRAEVFPLVILESLASGTPVIGFSKSGITDNVIPYETGLLAETFSGEALKDCMEKLLQDESLRKMMRFKCRQLVETEYRLEQQIDRYIDLYESL